MKVSSLVFKGTEKKQKRKEQRSSMDEGGVHVEARAGLVNLSEGNCRAESRRCRAD